MSYQYPYIEHFTPSPVTTTPNAFAQWDITQENAQQHQQQLQQQGQQELERTTPTSAASTPAGYEAPQVIQLTERVPRRRVVRIQNPAATEAMASTSNNTSVSPSTPLRHLHQLQQPTPQSVGGGGDELQVVQRRQDDREAATPTPKSV